jgi:hypothetical protein
MYLQCLPSSAPDAAAIARAKRWIHVTDVCARLRCWKSVDGAALLQHARLPLRSSAESSSQKTDALLIPSTFPPCKSNRVRQSVNCADSRAVRFLLQVLPARPLQYTLKDVRKERTVKYVRCYDVSWHGSPPLGDTTVSAALLEK